MSNHKTLLKHYYSQKSLVGFNIESYNKFIETGMQEIVNEIKKIVPDILPPGIQEFEVRLGNVWVDKPQVREADGTRRKIMPNEARLRGLTYEAPIMLEVKYIKNKEEGETKVVHVGNMPIMVKSKHCYLNGMSKDELIKAREDWMDPGGYFIINGTERVVVITEDLAPNRVFVEQLKTGPTPYVAKVFSEDNQIRIPHSINKQKSGKIDITFTRITKIPFTILVKALGLIKDKEIVDAINATDKMMSDIYINLYESAETKTQDEALNYIGKRIGVTQSDEKRIQRAAEMIDKFLLPHIGHEEKDRIYKAYFIAKAVRKLLQLSYNIIEEDDKDHYANKRLRLCGDMMETLFRFSFRMLIGDIKYNFERLVKRGKLPGLQAITRSQLLSARIKSSLATGEWVGGRHGISQHLERVNFVSTTSHLRRIVSSLTSSRENFEARDIHPTHWGKLCACETPEGPNVGLRKHLAITCEISTKAADEDDKAIMKALVNEGITLGDDK